jgi:hypothetical protein
MSMIAETKKKVDILLAGDIPGKFNLLECNDAGEREFAEAANRLIEFMAEIHAYIAHLSKGKLQHVRFNKDNFLASPFKELNSRLLTLTWQAKQIAKGDYTQRVDFLGEFAEAVNAMVISLDSKEKALKNKIKELEHALGHIKKLEGILPVCSFCKKIRKEDSSDNDDDQWVHIEKYIQDRTEAMFSHSICPECMKVNYPEFSVD